MTGIFAYSDNAVGDQENKFALHDFTKIKESTGIPIMIFQNASYHSRWAFDQAGGNFKWHTYMMQKPWYSQKTEDYQSFFVYNHGVVL